MKGSDMCEGESVSCMNLQRVSLALLETTGRQRTSGVVLS